jgi:hypothetical protein
MYVTSEATFNQAGIGSSGNGQLNASFCLQCITVIVTCLTALTGTPTVALDLQYGDAQNPNLGGNQDTSWASGAVSTGITVPITAGASASAVVLAGGGARAARVNVTWGTPSGSFKVQIAARDTN